MLTIATQDCPMCTSAGARVLTERSFQGRAWRLARCHGCGLHFTDPQPTDDQIRGFYAGDYHAGLLAAGRTEAAFGAKYERYARALQRHLPSGRVVDVGCATGFLVRMLRDRGYDAEGIELNRTSAEWGRTHYGVTIHTEPLERCGYEPGTLQAITMTDVLEHTPNPRDFLRMLGGYLAPGGVVLVTFPDIASVESRYYYWLSRLLRRDWLWSCCHIPKHTWEFTRRTAESCFQAAGFGVLEMARSQPVAEARTGSFALDLLRFPSRMLCLRPLDRWLGTQLEFIIRRA